MTRKATLVLVSVLLLTVGSFCQDATTLSAAEPGQAAPAPPPKGGPVSVKAGKAASPAHADQDLNAPATVGDVQKQVKQLKDDLTKGTDSDFALTLGVGSLILHGGVTDYSNQSNVLQANNLGRATPQYLVGVSMRTHIPNFGHLGGSVDQRKIDKARAAKDDKLKDCRDADPTNLPPPCELWRRRPWETFISIKFSPQASQNINGYVLGGSYAIAKYLTVLVGYSLSPINEPAPGFRVAASDFVKEQQKNGQDLNFDPVAMANNAPDAFDGFPLTDSSGKLIYKGNPLTIHFRGGAVVGVSIPITFSSVFKPAK